MIARLTLIVKDVYIFKEVSVVDFSWKGGTSIGLQPIYCTIPTFTSICNFFFAMHSYHWRLLVCKECTITRGRSISY